MHTNGVLTPSSVLRCILITIFLFGCKKEASPVTENSLPADNQRRTDQKGVEQRWISPGAFLMGASDSNIAYVLARRAPGWVANELPSEQPQHEVAVSKGYWIDTYEVTNGAFQAFAKDSGYYKMQYWSVAGKSWLSTQNVSTLPLTTGIEVSGQPRVNVTWFEAEAYANWRGGRLPTEAEWEYAARGPASNIYPWGNTFDTLKTNIINSSGLTAVGSFPKGVSFFGVHDMSGNAMEWVHDWLDVNYYKLKVHDDPQGPATGTVKVEKGGWWGSNEFVGRSSYRHYEDPPSYGDQHIGFRVVSNSE